MEKSVTNSLPKISIVTPSYNQGQFLEETLLSVLDQNYPNLEYFVMDGGSTDNSVEIIQKYAPRLTYWESKPDRGQSHAINKGFKMATGELVAWLNSDDLLLPGAVFEIAKIWSEDTTVGFIHGTSELIDESGESKGKYFGSRFDFLESLTTSRNTVAQPSTFISRNSLLDVGFLDETLHMSMDWELWLRVGAKYKTTFIPKVLSKTRHWPMTKTNTQLVKSGSEHLLIAKKLAKDKSLHLTQELKRKTLAAAYGKQALLDYQSQNRFSSKVALVKSLLYSPELKGGDARAIRKKVFPVYYFITQKLKNLKLRLNSKL